MFGKVCRRLGCKVINELWLEQWGYSHDKGHSCNTIMLGCCHVINEVIYVYCRQLWVCCIQTNKLSILLNYCIEVKYKKVWSGYFINFWKDCTDIKQSCQYYFSIAIHFDYTVKVCVKCLVYKLRCVKLLIL